MSRIGIVPIKIEDGVSIEVTGNKAVITGPMGNIEITIPDDVNIETKEGNAIVTRTQETKQAKSNHGTLRMLVANAVEGVKNGFQKKLEVVGVGYRAKMEGNNISIALGLNHPVIFKEVEGITFEVPDKNTIIIKGIDKQKVGLVAAMIRELRKPEPYKGKGIKYEDEVVRRKSAKVVSAS